MEALLLAGLVVGGLVFAVSRSQGGNTKKREQASFEDAMADARRWTERLGGQVLNIAGTDTASTQAIADASERFTAANSALSSAQTVKQAELARESALEGLHYMNAAREIMGLPAGPELPPLEGQRKAGKVTETRTINHEGQEITASPVATDRTPNYYPGGMVAGRPVPAGWYSTPWWASALTTGMWTAASFMMFSSLFGGMAGVGYGADQWEAGYGDGYEDGLAAAEGGDMGEAGEMGEAGDMGDMGDAGGDGDFFGGDGGMFDGGGFDFDFDF
ncbi:DUF1542 domain-containing protein [Corynebacterium sp. ZY180755]